MLITNEYFFVFQIEQWEIKNQYSIPVSPITVSIHCGNENRSFIIFGSMLWFFLFTQALSEEACVPLVCSPTRWLFCQKSNKVKSLIFLAPLHCIVRLHTTYCSQSHQRGSISSTYLHTVLFMKTNVLLIPYFCFLVFWSL